MDDLDIAAAVKAADDAHMGVIWIEHQVPRLGLRPGNGRAVGVLHMCAASVAYDIGAAAHIVKHPINEAGTVQAKGTHRSGARAASGPDLLGGSPAGVPAQDEAFAAPEIMDFAKELVGGQYHLTACLTESARQVGENFLYLLIGERKARPAADQALEQIPVLRLQHFLQELILFFCEAIFHRYLLCCFYSDGDVKDGFIILVLMLYRFCRVCDLIHIPKGFPQDSKVFIGQNGSAGAVAAGDAHGVDRQDVDPVIRYKRDASFVKVQRVIWIVRFDLLDLGGELSVEVSNGLGDGHPAARIGEEQSERRSDQQTHDADDQRGWRHPGRRS